MRALLTILLTVEIIALIVIIPAAIILIALVVIDTFKEYRK